MGWDSLPAAEDRAGHRPAARAGWINWGRIAKRAEAEQQRTIGQKGPTGTGFFYVD